MKKRIAELEKLILKYQKSYYDGEAEISDEEFDLLWNELKELSPDSRVISKIGAGSDAPLIVPEETGAYTVDGFPKARHLIPMGSQEKAANPVEFIAWAQKMGMETESPGKESQGKKKFIVQYKLDGASLELQYENGKLVRAVTRGDGITGDEITSNAKRMNGVAKEIKLPYSGGVRGEVIMTHDVWQSKYSSKANCRNAANGIMRRKDGEGCSNLQFMAYDAAANSDDAFFTDELQKIKWLKKQGFNTSETKVFCTAADIINYRDEISRLRDTLPFDIDGLVVKDMETDMDDLRRARPEKQIAFKFELETAFSVLRQIEWSESGATYTPIGIVDPVRIAGTTVQRANLNNPGMIRALNLKIGSIVSVVKRGEIIPKIESLAPPGALPVTEEIGSEIEFPKNCASCGSELVDANTRLFCPNPGCPKRLLHRLEKWVDVLDIRELGEKLVSQLFSKNRVQKIHDLYTLDTPELAAFERMGELSAAKVIRHIRTLRELSLSAFIAGFDFEGIAETTMEKIANAGYDTLDKLRRASIEELAAVHGIGTITAGIISAGLRETADDMDAVLKTGIISVKIPLPRDSLPLRGLSFCFTGELSSMKRNHAEEKIKALGAQAKSTVVKDLSYLVTNDPASHSSKNKKARELGIKIINEEEFLSLIQENRVSLDTAAPVSDTQENEAHGQGLLF